MGQECFDLYFYYVNYVRQQLVTSFSKFNSSVSLD